jgi:RimJ/RimL family protein N-acetyltransferase
VASRLIIEPLREEHLMELATCLRHPEVYEHIGGLPPLDEFLVDRQNALRGPGPEASTERWLHFLVREASTHRVVGSVEATLHHSLAEVAFLFNPSHWGKGLASEALAWLHREVEVNHGVSSFWATTIPANTRCQALLVRAGYRPAHVGIPVLYSFEDGDLVFQRGGPA